MRDLLTEARQVIRLSFAVNPWWTSLDILLIVLFLIQFIAGLS